MPTRKPVIAPKPPPEGLFCVSAIAPATAGITCSSLGGDAGKGGKEFSTAAAMSCFCSSVTDSFLTAVTFALPPPPPPPPPLLGGLPGGLLGGCGDEIVTLRASF